MGLAARAFAEDKLMIEVRERVIDDAELPQVMPTAHDHDATLFNRLVENVARQEGEAARQAA